jgi:hypothetical protein
MKECSMEGMDEASFMDTSAMVATPDSGSYQPTEIERRTQAAMGTFDAASIVTAHAVERPATPEGPA